MGKTDRFFYPKAKLERAREHIDVLKREIEAQSKNHGLSLVQESNKGRTRHALRLRVRKELPLLRWALIAGDALQNMRTALDQSICALVAARTGRDPTADDRLAFPICSEPKRLSGALNQIGELQRDTGICRTIRSLQPYNRRTPPRPGALWVLQTLNNTDKHRVVNVTCAAIKTGAASLSGLEPNVEVVGEMLAKSDLKDGTEVLVITLSKPCPTVKIPEATVKLQIAILHPEAPRDDGQNDSSVGGLLDHIHGEVSHCLAELSKCLPAK